MISSKLRYSSIGGRGEINLLATGMMAGKNNHVPLCKSLIPTHFPRRIGFHRIEC